MNDIIQAISTVGFPIVVAGYALIKLDSTIHENTIILTKLYERLDICNHEKKENEY